MYRDWKRGKNLFFEIREGEWANCIIRNILYGDITSINSQYADEQFDTGLQKQSM